MKSDLSYIDASSKEAVDRQKALPAISADRERAIAKAHTLPIAGLAVFDEASAEAEREHVRDGKRKLLRAFERDAQELTQALADRKIVPLAVLPATAWHAMCKRAGLFTFSADKAGFVKVSAEPLKAFEANASRAIKRIRTVGEIALLIASVGLLSFGMMDGLFWQSIACVCLAFGLFYANVYDQRTEEGRTSGTKAVRKSGLYRMLVRGQLRKFGRMPFSQALDLLLPDYASPAFSDVSAQVVLPEPPRDVAATLLKARGLSLKTAAAREAIAFAEAPAMIYARSFGEALKLDDQNWQQVRQENDPIVFLEKGTAVAIIAQFGDFPIEKEMVDAALFGADLIESH